MLNSKLSIIPKVSWEAVKFSPLISPWKIQGSVKLYFSEIYNNYVSNIKSLITSVSIDKVIYTLTFYVVNIFLMVWFLSETKISPRRIHFPETMKTPRTPSLEKEKPDGQ